MFGKEHTEPDDATRHSHHPEHAVDGHTMGRSRKDASNDNHECCENYGSFTAEIITGQALLINISLMSVLERTPMSLTRRLLVQSPRRRAVHWTRAC